MTNINSYYEHRCQQYYLPPVMTAKGHLRARGLIVSNVKRNSRNIVKIPQDVIETLWGTL